MINKIVVHCSDTPTGRDVTAAEIHKWHKDRGWDGIGYHYVIRIDGTVENGRPEYWKGAHASGHNKDSIGICLIGQGDYTDKQEMSLIDLIANIKARYKGIKIIGHNEVSKKLCPMFNVQKWLDYNDTQIEIETVACDLKNQLKP